MTTATTPKKPKQALPQPKCAGCNHVASFHRNGKSRCYVAGCECKKWAKPV